MPHPHLPAAVTSAASRHRAAALYFAATLTTAFALLWYDAMAPSGHVIAPAYPAIGAALLAMPLAFAASAVRRQLARARVADLLVTLAAPPTVGAVRDVLRRALKDPSAELHLWVPEQADPGSSHPDSSHRPAPTGGTSEKLRRFVVPVQAWDGTPLATAVLNPALERNRDVVDVAVSACALALENTRLRATLRVQLDQVRACRTRIVEAGFAERRRLERDLHDGAQQRLLALATRIGLARSLANDPGTLAALDDARVELHAALADLRELARGIHPVVLRQAGLRPAVETVLASLPLTVRLQVPQQRFDTVAETTAYYVICEALTNVVKHAEADEATVTVTDTDTDTDTDTAVATDTVTVGPAHRHLVVEVADDGRGGADVRGGTGLAGLNDRLRDLGGDLTIHSPVHGGTQLRARIPCA